jgi:hypothetical protein
MWEQQGGLNFQLSTQVMRALESEEAFMKKVRRLGWVAFFHNEAEKSVKVDCLPNPKTPWWSLSLFTRQFFNNLI